MFNYKKALKIQCVILNNSYKSKNKIETSFNYDLIKSDCLNNFKHLMQK